MIQSLQLRIVYEDAGEGWVMASIPQVPGTHSQGATRDEARANVVDALRVMLAGDDEHLTAGTQGGDNTEPLELIIAT
jgi:predicted RNase H-like HicB family nuclease